MRGRAGIITVGAVVLSMLVGAGGASAAGRCGEVSERPWCNTALSPDERAGLLLGRMTQDEKFELMAGDDTTGVLNPPVPNPETGEVHTGTSIGVARLGIPTVFFSDGPVGSRQGQATPLPSTIGLAATFDPGLASRHGAVVGNEAKLKGNDFVLAPGVNIMRNPRGGRTFEYYGEDPFLSSRIAVGWINGLQGEGVVGNVKHYAVNSQEGDPGQPASNRFVTNSVIDERTMREIYLPAFEAAVKEANVGTVMGAYNAVNGQASTENQHLLLDILKGDWGFDGFVLTDYGAQRSTVNAANNGLDLELPQEAFFSRENLQAAVAGRQIGQDVIDEHVRRILRVYFEYGLLDREDYAYNQNDKIDKAGHNAETRIIQEASTTLLKNAGETLPVRPAAVKSIAVIGPSADEYKSGGGSSNIDPFTPPVTPCDGIKARGEAAGVEVTCSAGDSPAAAAAAAKDKDMAIVVATDNLTEFLDKSCIRLQDQCDRNNDGDQDARIRAVAAANPNTVALLETGAPVVMPWADEVEAIVQAWYPGQEGGTAMARVLFGDVDPGGRLPVSFPREEGDVPTAGNPAQYPGIGADAVYSEGVFQGYRHYDEKEIAPLFEFGHGLSYTTFRYGALRVEPAADGSARAVATVDVTNTGTRQGIEIPQLYLRMPDPKPGVAQPPRWLRGFQKLSLAPGETRTARFELDPRAFSFWDTDADDFRVARGCYEVIVGRSSRDTQGSAVLEQGGAQCAGAVPRPRGAATPGSPPAAPGKPNGKPGGALAPCRATSSLRSAAVRPRGRRLRLAAPARTRIDVFQHSLGRRVLGERLVARLRGRSRAFTWNGRANRRGRTVRDGVYSVRFRAPGGESRRVTLRRVNGRFRVRPAFERREGCGLLRRFKLERPAFGGRSNRALLASYRLRADASVTVQVLRGRRVVRRLASGNRRAGITYRLRFDSERRPRGDYRIRIVARRAGGAKETATLTSRRL